MKNQSTDTQMQTLRKHMELRKEFQDTCETRIGDNKDLYIKHLETQILAYREKFGIIDLTKEV